MLRTVSPQPPAVVTPERSRSAKTSGSLRELEPVQLDVLAGRELAVAAAVEVRDLADRPQRVRRELAGRHLDAQHERADLRLVVVEAPPLEPHDVLLGDVLVALRDQRRELVADAERRLVALDPLDRVALEDELPVDRTASRALTAGHRTDCGAEEVKLL